MSMGRAIAGLVVLAVAAGAALVEAAGAALEVAAGAALAEVAPPIPPAVDLPATPPLTDAQRKLVLSLSPLPPPPADPTNSVGDDPRAAEIGRRLFFDARLSGDGTISCATCHVPELGFGDGRRLSRGLADLPRHAPTIWNVAYQRWFFWDGRADTPWAQAIGPLEHPDEMAGSPERLVAVLRDDEALRARFVDLFGSLPPADASRDAVMRAAVNALKSIAAFERTLVSAPSPFDRFVEAVRKGDAGAMTALSPEARRGLVLFVGKAACVTCHSGPLLSDREFHDTRVAPLGGGAPTDPGRFEGLAKLRAAELSAGSRWSDAPAGKQAALSRRLVKEPRQWGEFKTPSLRNVALSPPYMHQGQFATLMDVVNHYDTLDGATPLGHHSESILKPLGLTPTERSDLVAFLESLTGEGAAEAAAATRPGGADQK